MWAGQDYHPSIGRMLCTFGFAGGNALARGQSNGVLILSA